MVDAMERGRGGMGRTNGVMERWSIGEKECGQCGVRSAE